MKAMDELMKMKNSKEYQDSGQMTKVDAVLLQDVLSSISAPTVVLKLDIEGYECKVDLISNSFSAFEIQIQIQIQIH